MQKTHWWSRTSCRKFWCFDHSRPPNSWRRLRIYKRSPICCGGARLGYSMDSIISVQTKNFTGNRKELAKVLVADQETQSHLHWKIPRICQGLWRSFVESLHVNRHRSETNGIAEWASRRIKEGTSAVLSQSGLDEKWWADFMECYCYVRNIQDRLSDGKTPYERRFAEPIKGPITPFGYLVEYHSTSPRDQSRIHLFGKKVLPGIFLGCVLYAGGILKGDIQVADLEELEKMDASEIHAERLNAKKGDPTERWWRIHILRRRWNIKNLLGRSDTENLHLTRNHPIRGDSHHDFLGESEGSPRAQHFQDSYPDAGEARNDFWSISGHVIYRHHVEPRVKLCTPREESFPIPLKILLTSPGLLILP